MIIAKRLRGKAIAAWLGPAGDAARRAVESVKSTVNRGKVGPSLAFYFDVSDPWSYLAAQALDRLVRAYGVDFSVTVITPPASDVDAQPIMRSNHAVRDSKELAAYYDLDFPGKRTADPGIVREVATCLIKERGPVEQLAAILALGRALWANDKKDVAKIVGHYGFEGHNSVPPILNENYAALRKAGHYQGAMIRHAGEWYWGVDRLDHLEEALAKETGKPVAHVVSPRPESAPERAPEKLVAGDKPLVVEMWFSFRSPYSYLALQQIEKVVGDTPLVLRPILPMVSRGAPLVSAKKFYIVRDAKREADQLGIPFGEVCDPLGQGITNCLAIAKWADSLGPAQALAWAKSATTGSWAEARDVGEYVDLKFLVERAGLNWDQAREALDPKHAEAVTKWAAQAATDLGTIGLWGVPSFRAGDLVTWGNDRLPILADRLRRHRAA